MCGSEACALSEPHNNLRGDPLLTILGIEFVEKSEQSAENHKFKTEEELLK